MIFSTPTMATPVITVDIPFNAVDTTLPAITAQTAPAGTVAYDQLSAQQQTRAFARAKVDVMKRFESNTTINDLPQELQNLITAFQANSAAELLMFMASEPVAQAWFDQQAMTLVRQKVYMTDTPSVNAPTVEQL